MGDQHTKTPKEWLEYFWGRAMPEPMSGCFLWTGPVTPDGYGRQGKRLAHRVAWELRSGETLSPGQHVLHRCDTPCCINPDHLFIGTQIDNMEDMRRKGRRRGIGIGIANGRAKLDDEAVAAIRDLADEGFVAREIAPCFGVAMSTIYRVLRGELWSHTS